MKMDDETTLFRLPPPGVQTRWASMENPDALPGASGTANNGRKGAPCRHWLEPGEELPLAHWENGPGTVRRFWITIDDRSPKMLRGLVLRVWWDGAETPAIEAPLGDFFCLPLGRMTAFENAWFDTGEGRSFNCRILMPFRKGFRMSITNETPDVRLRLFFYDVNFTVGDTHGDDVGYVHAHWRRESPTTLCQDFEILPQVTGRGRFLGCNLGVMADRARYNGVWWGEGEVKMYLDGDDTLPTLCGTGTEDYIGTGWGQGAYARQWHGSPLADASTSSYGFYRLHGPDPVYFHEHLRVTMQQIGHGNGQQLAAMLEASGETEIPLAGGGTMTADELRASPERGFLFERQDDWCATAYFVLDKPESGLPPIVSYEERIAGLGTGDADARKRMDE
jgi:hypothetical protein